MMKLSELRSNDLEVRCVIVKTFTNKIKHFYPESEEAYLELKSKYPKAITVFEADDNVEKVILNLVDKQNSEDGKVGISAEDFIVEVVGLLSDLDIDLDRVRDKEQIANIIANPNKMFLALNREITVICNEIIDTVYNNLVDFSSRPEGMQQVYLDSVAEQLDLPTIDEEAEKKRKEIEELEAKIKELKGE